MRFEFDHPIIVFFLTLMAMWLAGRGGARLARWHRPDQSDVRETFNIVQGAALTLLGLIIGFTFSMAISRYDQRKNYEEAEANAIGTEYVRFDLLTPVSYLDQRIVAYEATDRSAFPAINARVGDLQSKLWGELMPMADERPNPITALVVSGMNDVLNSQGYTQAAWWNRIPKSAWMLMAAIALGCNLLLGIGASKLTPEPALMLVLPLLIAIAFGLIADIDSPRGGLIRVAPQNLQALRASLPGA